MKVSVIIPLYNARDVIQETVQSVLAQTWNDYEIIVIDDGSTDGSGDVVRALGQALRYIRQENVGVACARNRGIAESTGTYIALLDHDDLWHPTKLEKQVTVLDQQPRVGMVITDVALTDRAGRQIGTVESAYKPANAFPRLFIRGYEPTPSAAMIRRSVLAKVGGFDEDFDSASLDDQELWARIAAQYEIVNIGEALTYHRNRWPDKPHGIFLGHRPLLIAKLLERFGNDLEKRRYLLGEQASYFSDFGKHLIQRGAYREGRSYLLQGLLLSLGEGRSLKTAWRCLLRLARSYLLWRAS